MAESFAPLVVVDEKEYKLTGRQWLQVYAMAGCAWAKEDLKRLDFLDAVAKRNGRKLVPLKEEGRA